MKGNSDNKNHLSHHEMMIRDFKRRFFISLFFSIPILVLSPFIQELFGFDFGFYGDKYFLLGFSTLIFFYGGWPFLKNAFKEIKKRQPGMMTLIGLATSISFLYSAVVVFGLSGEAFFWELATLIDVMLIGHYVEMRSTMGASQALRSLARLIPAEAHLLRKDGVEDVPVSKLTLKDIVLVKPGEKIPADGVITKGETTVNEAMLTGESSPVSKGEGDEVIGGALNGVRAIEVKVTRTGEDSYLSRVMNLVQEAQKSKSKTQSLVDKTAFWLTVSAIFVGVVTLSTWLFLGRGFAFALGRMVTVMVITCPHALGLAVPLVVSISTSISAKNGLLIRDRVSFEQARNVDVVVFDKTGTLTKGEFGVTDVVPLGEFARKDVLRYAAGLEANSGHPIAKGILKKAKEENIKPGTVDEFSILPGIGIRGVINGENVKAVGQNYLRKEKIEVKSKDVEGLLKAGKTLVYLILGGEVIGVIGLADVVRGESKEAVNSLRKMGIKSMMLTGDNKEVAEWVAQKLGLDDFFAEILPHEKSEIIKKIQSQETRVAMVGDGVNDAPALVQADIGIAIGAGTDVAIEAADVVLVRNDPRDVVSVIKLAEATYNKMKQNLIWATGYNVVAIPLAAGVLYDFGILLSPAFGALLMSLSTVVVAFNAKLLRVDLGKNSERGSSTSK